MDWSMEWKPVDSLPDSAVYLGSRTEGAVVYTLYFYDGAVYRRNEDDDSDCALLVTY